MSSARESGVGFEGGPREIPASPEVAYERLAGYGFARRYVGGKAVAEVASRSSLGYGSRLLAESAASVVGLSELPAAVELARALYPAPNVGYRTAELPALPLPEGSFDVVVALGALEELQHPGELLSEAKRVLKGGGVLLVSAPDRRAVAADGRRGMHAAELRALLEGHFAHVRLYRQGAVAGGFVFPESGEAPRRAPVEGALLSSGGPRLGAWPPMTRSVVAVCSDEAGALGPEGGAYLLLDRERRLFDEYDERAEDVELLRAEIQRMQETEVQAFVEAIKIRQNLLRELLRSPFSYRMTIFREVRHRGNLVRAKVREIRESGPVDLARGAFRHSSALYQRLRKGREL